MRPFRYPRCYPVYVSCLLYFPAFLVLLCIVKNSAVIYHTKDKQLCRITCQSLFPEISRVLVLARHLRTRSFGNFPRLTIFLKVPHLTDLSENFPRLTSLLTSFQYFLLKIFPPLTSNFLPKVLLTPLEIASEIFFLRFTSSQFPKPHLASNSVR